MLAVLVFDSASVPMIERLLDEGRLPALAELSQRGQRHALETPATRFSAATYPSLYSGMDVGEHGLYYPFMWSAAEQRVRYVDSFPPYESVWERLSRAGRRALVIDPYEALTPRAVSGICISGWQCKNRVTLRAWSLPRGMHRKLARRFGRPRAAEEVFGRPSISGLLNLRRRLLSAPSRGAELAEELLGRERFDFLWISFPAAHLGGHQFWDLSQLSDSQHDAARRGGLGDALADIYAAVDAAIGRTVAALPADADLIVLSPIGMGVNTGRPDLLPEMLEAVLAGGSAQAGSARTGAGDSIWRLRAAVPAPWRAAVAGALPDRLVVRLTTRLQLRGVDWSRTRAFALPSDHQGFVRLNLRGREREGIVDAAEADALMDEIADGLRTYRDPDGTPSIVAVEQVPEIADGGARVDQLPDLVVRWNDRPATRLTGVSSPRYGDVVRRGGGSGRSGNHLDDAWVIIAPGASRTRKPSRPPRINDIAATVCGPLGADTSGLPGEPLLEPA